jgi:chromosome segregation ATPase
MESTRTFDAPDGATDGAFVDTIALLQEEVARLEAELRLRDEQPVLDLPEVLKAPGASEAERRVEELAALLDERDEAISLLWEQLSTIEEAQAARSAEWDQLHHWVEELEARFGDGADPTEFSGESRREAEALRDQLEIQRRGWEAQRSGLEQEIAELRARLNAAASATASDDPTLAMLEQENRRLRDECRRLSEPRDDATEVEALKLALDRANARLQAVENDLNNQRLRHEEELTQLRTNQARSALSSADLTPNERVKALREHLQELHAKEEVERKERQLSARISRLLGRGGARR